MEHGQVRVNTLETGIDEITHMKVLKSSGNLLTVDFVSEKFGKIRLYKNCCMV